MSEGERSEGLCCERETRGQDGLLDASDDASGDLDGHADIGNRAVDGLGHSGKAGGLDFNESADVSGQGSGDIDKTLDLGFRAVDEPKVRLEGSLEFVELGVGGGLEIDHDGRGFAFGFGLDAGVAVCFALGIDLATALEFAAGAFERLEVGFALAIALDGGFRRTRARALALALAGACAGGTRGGDFARAFASSLAGAVGLDTLVAGGTVTFASAFALASALDAALGFAGAFAFAAAGAFALERSARFRGAFALASDFEATTFAGGRIGLDIAACLGRTATLAGCWRGDGSLALGRIDLDRELGASFEASNLGNRELAPRLDLVTLVFLGVRFLLLVFRCVEILRDVSASYREVVDHDACNASEVCDGLNGDLGLGTAADFCRDGSANLKIVRIAADSPLYLFNLIAGRPRDHHRPEGKQGQAR